MAQIDLFYYADQTIDRHNFLKIVAKSLKNHSEDTITFRKCIFDFDLAKLLREVFFKKSNSVKTFDFRHCILKKPLISKDVKCLTDKNILIIK